MAGENTGKFGEWLTGYLEGRPYQVFYDHGDPQPFPNVAKVTGFVGDQVARHNQLAQIDVMVAGHTKEAVLLIELEESDFTPKRILGDVFSILMCNRISVRVNHKQVRFEITPHTRLIVAGIASTSSKTAQIKKSINPRLHQFSVPIDSIQTRNVNIVGNSDLESTVSELKEIVKAMFPSETSAQGDS